MELYKTLFPKLAEHKWARLNLNDEANGHSYIDVEKCERWIQSLHKRDEVDYSYGGYLENRADLWRGHYLPNGKTIHIGVDFNVPQFTPVRLPIIAKLIFAEEDLDQDGGWGTRLIFTTGDIYVTFAHLWLTDLNVGICYRKGTLIGEVAPPNRNGGWYPHLHVHVQTEYDTSQDGYQYEHNLNKFIFPNPEIVLQ